MSKKDPYELMDGIWNVTKIIGITPNETDDLVDFICKEWLTYGINNGLNIGVHR